MQKNLTEQLKQGLEELKTLRDEIRLDLHLASMDLKDEWKELERKLPDGAFASDLKEAGTEVLESVAAELRRFRARLRGN